MKTRTTMVMFTALGLLLASAAAEADVLVDKPLNNSEQGLVSSSFSGTNISN